MFPSLVETYLALLIAMQGQHWPEAPQPWIMAAQVEKETCITLKHPKCWSPRAELKTSRENGIGFGQFTRAYKADGSIRFDYISDMNKEFKELRGWNWGTRYDPNYQMAALVLADRKGYAFMQSYTLSTADVWRFSLAGYNGGMTSVVRDRLLCKQVQGCNPTVWYGNVELYSHKSRQRWQGYGESPFSINRGYVRRIESRAPAYQTLWEKKK